MKIRSASADDAPALAFFARDLFVETFGPQNDPANIASYVGHAFDVDAMRQTLQRDDARTLIGEADGAIVCYAMLLPETPPAHLPRIGDGSVLLQRFYLQTSLHGSGAADRLMDATRDAAGALGSRSIWLTVWDENPRAIRFYEKRGFERIGSCDFLLGADRQTDVVMRLALD